MNNSEFKERVKKTFGNLLTSASQNTPTPLSNPLWSLTGAQIEKREWRRDEDTSDRDNNPCAASFDDFVSCARNNLKDYKKEFDNGIDYGDGDDDGMMGAGGLDDWDLRGSIGLDSTLDNEEEEDAYDKVAIGRENASERLYMGAVANNNIPSSVSPDDLSPVSGARRRDPRANHLAAKIRLEEDDAEVGAEAGQHKTTHDPPTSVEKEHISSAARDGDLVKPILKRKEHNSTLKSTKRVKFDPEFVKEGNTSLSDKENMGSQIPSDDVTSVNQSDERVSRVPDYVRNPSKYTCYSLDSSDEMNDKSTGKSSPNSGSQSENKDDSTDLPKSIPFVPKKKPDSGKADDVTCGSTNNGDSDLKKSSAKSTVIAGFVDEDVREPQVGDMEVDEPERSGIPSSKKDRQYRTKPQAVEPE